jgi:hypothetical protein
MREKKESAKEVCGYLNGSCFLLRRELGNRARGGSGAGGEETTTKKPQGRERETRVLLTGLVTSLERASRKQGRPFGHGDAGRARPYGHGDAGRGQPVVHGDVGRPCPSGHGDAGRGRSAGHGDLAMDLSP